MRPANDDGYATPAATVISAAISLVVTAIVARSLADLHLARAELSRTQVEYALTAAHNAAMLAIATSTRPPPYHWTVANLGSSFDVVAEPERPKMSPQAFAGLSDATIAALGVDDTAVLKDRLSSLSVGSTLSWIEDQDDSATWRECAASVVSPFGARTTLAPPAYEEPVAGKTAGFWRAGEVWRIQVTGTDGWRDERIIRFTGNGLNPAAVLGRRLSRGWKGTQTCQGLFENELPA